MIKRSGLSLTSGMLLLASASLVQAQLQFSPVPPRTWGQVKVQAVTGSPNLVEGREMNGPQSVAVDTSVSPPILYISDTFNNRVLVYKNALSVSNGQKADLFIGQPDEFTTTAGGPGTSSSVGLFRPSGIVVDKSGNLYVADTGNNRIVRFPTPVASVASGNGTFPDLVLGQKSFSTNAPNNNLRLPGPDTLAIGGASAYPVGLAFDPNGNLWVTDSYNLRVLRYPASGLAAGTNGLAANLVLGQSSFTSATVPTVTLDSRFDKTVMEYPSSVAVDGAGRVYVGDNLVRVLVYVPASGGDLQNGQAAARVIGATKIAAGDPLTPTAFSLGTFDSGGRLNGTVATFIGPNGNVYVLDAGANRILQYDPYPQWAAETTTTSGPQAKAVYGQAASDFQGAKVNAGSADATSSGLNFPLAATIASNHLYIADASNNRVLVSNVDGSGTPASSASAVLGQVDFPYAAPNEIDGRELFVFNGFSSLGSLNVYGQFSDGGGVVVDSHSNPPRLYVADTYNNRILGFKDARNIKTGDRADMVIGQADLNRSLINSPSNDPTSLSDQGLYRPSSVAIDANGSLWVADSYNGRVLRYASPFNNATHSPNLVLGQRNFTSQITSATSQTMARPFGIAFTQDGSVLVSDAVHSRVLFFRKPAGGDFRNFQTAEKVIGQPDFGSSNPGTADNRMTSPRHIATDTSDRLYVCDTGNGRVLIYDSVSTSGADPSPATSITNLNYPHGVFVSPTTGEIWVTNTYSNTVQRFLNFNRLITQKDPDTTIQVAAPLDVTLDGFGNLIVLEGLNRISFYFPGGASINAASFTSKALSPGVIAALFPLSGGTLSDTSASASTAVLPTTLADVQVQINGTPAPLFAVTPGQINYLMPMGVGTSGTASFSVVKQSTGQILATGQLLLAPYTPSLFTTAQNGSGQVAAINVTDGAVNSAANPVKRGDYISIYGTGQGFVSKAPPDGVPASGPISTDTLPQVLIGTTIVPSSAIQYSGLAPGLPGVWQINVQVPSLTAPSNATPLVVIMGGSYASNDAPGSTSTNKLATTIAVK